MFSIIITLILIHIIRTIIIVIMSMHIVIVIILILVILSAAAIIVILMINPLCLDASYCFWLAAFVLATDRSASFACWTRGFRFRCVVSYHVPLA
jgi:hypothetical protein